LHSPKSTASSPHSDVCFRGLSRRSMSLPPFNHWEFLLLGMSRTTARLILISLRTPATSLQFLYMLGKRKWQCEHEFDRSWCFARVSSAPRLDTLGEPMLHRLRLASRCFREIHHDSTIFDIPPAALISTSGRSQ
jgi:hypothetical protein